MAQPAVPPDNKTAAPKPKPLVPPDERFWKRYSPHHEMELASAASVTLHVLLVVLVAVAASLWFFSDFDPNSNDQADARWWMTEAETVPYSAEADAAIPVGTVIPGVVISGEYSGDRADVRGGARWQDGWWTLEATRVLATGSKYDIDFVAGEPLYLWVAVFDHTQTRHTRHMRPVRLDLR